MFREGKTLTWESEGWGKRLKLWAMEVVVMEVEEADRI